MFISLLLVFSFSQVSGSENATAVIPSGYDLSFPDPASVTTSMDVIFTT
jgi:hypothetical protein